MSNENSLRVDVPLDFSPSLITAQHKDAMGPNTAGGAVLSTAASIMGEIYSTMGKIADARKANAATVATQPVDVHGRPLPGQVAFQLEPSRVAALASAMDVAFRRLAPKFEQNIRTMEEQRAKIQKRIDDVFVEDHQTRQFAGEIRSHFASIPNGAKRLSEAMNAIGSGSDADALATAKALLRPAPAYLSGFTSEQLALLRAKAARRFAPKDFDQLERAGKIIDHVRQRSESFVSHFKKLRPKATAGTAADKAIAALAQ